MKKPFKLSKSFTIIEVLIGAVILALVGVGAIAVEKEYMQSSSYNKQKLQAVGLAQEGLNLTRSIFDTNVIAGADVWTGLGGDAPSPSQSYNKLVKDANGKWQLAPGEETITLNGVEFKRKIFIEE